jgi:hypothetical protein
LGGRLPPPGTRSKNAVVGQPAHGRRRGQQAICPLIFRLGHPRCLPGTLDGLTRLWRDRIAGQRALLVLDNAACTDQVTPLLPGAGNSLVLITSRRHLGDLPGAASATLLDVLPPHQARDMFLRLAPNAAGSGGEVTQLAQLAGV